MNATIRRRKSTPKIRRGFSRRSASSKVKITCHKKGQLDAGPSLSTVVLDLSEAGARFLVTSPLQVGEDIVLGLQGPSYRHPLTRPGKVVWSFQVTDIDYAVGVRLDEHLDGNAFQEATIPPVRLDY